MELEAIKAQLTDWSASNSFVLQSYIFGSRVRDDFTNESDLDIALVIYPMPGDSSCLATWIHKSSTWETELKAIFPFKIDLQLFDGDTTPTIKTALEQSSVLVFSRAIK